VLANENWWESDFVEAKTYYEKAVQSSQGYSATSRAEFMRSLATMCFVEDPAVQDIDKGRESYEGAINTLENRTDAYSKYARFFTYKAWAVSEIQVRNLSRGADLLARAYTEFFQIPTGTGVMWLNDLRDLVFQYVYLGAGYFKARDDENNVEKGRLAFREAQKVTESLSNQYGSSSGYTVDARGVLFHGWGQQELEAGFTDEAQQHLAQAEQEFQRLPDDFPWKEFRLAELRRVRSQVAQGEMPTQPPPRNLSANADHLLRESLKPAENG
jgi:hypothetical protein